MTDNLTILGATIRNAITADKLETFPAPPGIQMVRFSVEEFTSMCPITGQPDYSTIDVAYVPSGKCLESKSLKLYLWSFRDKGVFCEALAAEIADALQAKLQSEWLMVSVTQNVRGGIRTSADAKRSTKEPFNVFTDIQAGDEH